MKKITPLILLLIAAMLMTSGFMTVTAAGDKDVLDYSDPTSSAMKELKASEFIQKLLGETVSELEKGYVDGVFGDVFAYSDYVPQKNVEVRFEDDVLYVSASVYTYTAVNGESVQWVPDAVRVGGKNATLEYDSSSEKYEAEIEELEDPDGIDAYVTYVCIITVDGKTSDYYKDYAYNCAVALDIKKTDYEEQLDAYYAYQRYLGVLNTYNTNYALWQAYIQEKIKYDEKYAEYERYEADLAYYNVKLAEYNAYKQGVADFPKKLEEYNQYLVEKAAYDVEYKKYEQYLADMSVVMKKLEVMENIFVKNSKGKQMYATLMGDTVAEVVSRKNELVTIGKCDPNDIDNAASSTDKLKSLLSSYAKLGTTAEKYAYYQRNYTSIRVNFSTLYNSLYSLYQNPAVVSALSNRGKLDRFIEFLSQLYVIKTGLNDSESRDSSWTIKGLYDMGTMSYKTYHYYDVLEACQLPADSNNADPSDLTTVPEYMEQPIPPFVVEEPKMPEPVDEPVAPDAVIKPTPPAVVDEPKKPAHMDDPGPKPSPLVMTAKESGLLEAYKNGTLTKRGDGKSETVRLTTSVQKRVSVDNKSFVTFYSENGSEILYTYEADIGSPISFNGTLPTKSETDKYIYTFEGWRNESGELLTSLGNVENDAEHFYASFASTLKKYTVTWIVYGKESSEEYDYGTLPSYKGSTEKSADAQYTYSFAGWSDEIVAVSGDASYEAVFESEIRSYKITFVVDGVEHEATYEYGTLPSFSGNTDKASDSKFIYEFAGWDKELVSVNAEATYTASYNRYSIVEDENGEAIEVTETDKSYSVSVVGSIKVDNLMAMAEKNDKTVELKFENGLVLIFNAAAVNDMSSNGCVYVYAGNSSGRIVGTYEVRFTDKDGKDVALKYNVTVQTTVGGKACEYTRVYVTNEAGNYESIAYSYENGVITVKLTKGALLTFKNEYKIENGGCANGVLSADKQMAEAGDRIQLSLSFEDKYEIVSFKIVGISGKEYEIAADNSFIMPEEPVKISAELKLREFVIKFVVDGVVISEQVYHKGDTVVIPEDPTKPDDGDTIFTFIGWTPSVLTVTEDMTYTAKFNESVKSVEPPSHNKFYMLIIEVVLVLAVLIAAPIVIVKLVKKKKAKAKAENKASEGAPAAETEESAAEGNTEEDAKNDLPDGE